MSVATMVVPIERNMDGVLRVGGTRVTLDTLVTAFLLRCVIHHSS